MLISDLLTRTRKNEAEQQEGWLPEVIQASVATCCYKSATADDVK